MQGVWTGEVVGTLMGDWVGTNVTTSTGGLVEDDVGSYVVSSWREKDSHVSKPQLEGIIASQQRLTLRYSRASTARILPWP